MAKTKENYFVYAHVNKINRKVYVGITNSPKRRFRNKGIEYTGGNTVFGKAIKKYGWDKFEHIIIEKDVTLLQAEYLERLYIICLDAKIPNGYNMTDGGDGTKGYKLSEETKRRIGNSVSIARRGVKFSDEHKRNLSKSRKKLLEEKRKNGERLPAPRKPVNQYTFDGRFIARYESATEGYLATGCPNIGGVCNGKRKSSYGYVWRWA